MTKREKQDAAKGVIKELLEKKEYKSNELIDSAAEIFTARFGEETDNPNDVKGRIGSILDTMKKESEVRFDGGVYALKGETVEKKAEETVTETPAKPKRATKKTAKKETSTAEKTVAEKPKKATAKKSVKAEETVEKTTTEKTKSTTRKKTSVKAEKKESEETPAKETETEETLPLPPAPLQPIAPTAPVTPEVAPEPIPEPAPKKRGGNRKKAEKVDKVEEKPVLETVAETKAKGEETVEIKTEAKPEVAPEEKKLETALAVKEKAELSPKGTVMDMSFLFGDFKKKQPEQKTEQKSEQKPMQTYATPKVETRAEKQAVKAEEKPVQKPQEQQVKQERRENPEPKAENAPTAVKTAVQTKKEPPKQAERQTKARNARVDRKVTRELTADEKLQEAFLARLRRLGGEYFEYYSVYLLEKYSRRNGRRLEALRVNGGDHDGGIDGEIELTDRLGFRETIYIQAKNWDPDKGDEKAWVVGETLLQQFIGACVCRQMKQGKQNSRGIFITTSRFTPEAKRILQESGDRFVGYDGSDLYETAKECSFGLVKKNGEWSLDETLLAGEKAFFNLL